MPWKCFLVEPTDKVQRTLRVYDTGRDKCPGPLSYHNAEVVIDPELPLSEYPPGGYVGRELEGDPRWPKKCGCGHVFSLAAATQINVDRLYAGAPDGQLYRIRQLPIGAMWVAEWFDHPRYKGPDGKAWCVMMPGGHEWIVYGPSADGKPWDVQGTPPLITVSPSIGMGQLYHGFIKGGVISEDVDGRKYHGVPRTA